MLLKQIGQSYITHAFILTFLFFFIKEYVFRKPNIFGAWHFTTFWENTAYNPYINMELKYTAYLCSNGSSIYGTAEKTGEIVPQQSTEKLYIGKDRTRVVITGYIQKRYLSRSRIELHLIEKGENRESTSIHKLTYSRKLMKGHFISSVANTKGKSEWLR